MKKILFINSSLGSGGAERQMVKLIELINTHDITPHVLTYCDLKDDYPNNASMTRHNVRFSGKMSRNFKLLFEIIKIRPKVILSYCGDPNILACIYKLLNWRCKVIVSERNISSLPLSRREKMMYFLYRFVSLIVSNSKSQEKLLKDLYPNLAKKIITIHNYTELPDSCATFHSPQIPRISLFARYHPQKNIIGFIKAVSRANEKVKTPFVCEWYGRDSASDGRTSYREHCIGEAKKLGVDNIAFNDFTDNTKQVMMESDVICLPSLKEGFSNTLSEAICYGKPILASNVSDNSLFAENGVNGYLFDPNDVNDIADAIVRIIENVDKFEEFGRNSYRKAQALFDKDAFIDSYINILCS